MAEWRDPKTTNKSEDQVTPELFNNLAENEQYLYETKITTEQVKDATVTSTQASSRTNLTASETIKAAFGKIRKWFADLKALAFKDKVSTSDIEDGAVTSTKIGTGAVTSGKVSSVAASKVTGLATVATTGSYSDLKDIPSDVDLSPYIRKADLLNYIYPVGSIRVSTSSTNPGTYLGGTWVQWGAGRVPVGVNSSDTDFSSVEKTGGTKAVTLTTAQIPSHKHSGSQGTAEGVQGFYNTFNGRTGYAVELTYKPNGGANIGESTETQPTGGGGSHTNLQPYITCYMWKRTA